MLISEPVLLEENLRAAPEYEVDAAKASRAYSEFLHGYHCMPIEFEARPTGITPGA